MKEFVRGTLMSRLKKENKIFSFSLVGDSNTCYPTREQIAVKIFVKIKPVYGFSTLFRTNHNFVEKLNQKFYQQLSPAQCRALRSQLELARTQPEHKYRRFFLYLESFNYDIFYCIDVGQGEFNLTCQKSDKDYLKFNRN